MNEIWKDIKGYEGEYQISNLGNVKSLKYNKERMLIPLKHRQGYKTVILQKQKTKRQYLIHRLVAEAFIPNIHNYREVNHIDEDKGNNNIDNLEWCTGEYNIHYGTGILRNKLKHKKKVIQYDKYGNFLNIFDSIQEAQKSTNVQASNIGRCCNNKRDKAGGYIWKYASS